MKLDTIVSLGGLGLAVYLAFGRGKDEPKQSGVETKPPSEPASYPPKIDEPKPEPPPGTDPAHDDDYNLPAPDPDSPVIHTSPGWPQPGSAQYNALDEVFELVNSPGFSCASTELYTALFSALNTGVTSLPQDLMATLNARCPMVYADAAALLSEQLMLWINPSSGVGCTDVIPYADLVVMVGGTLAQSTVDLLKANCP